MKTKSVLALAVSIFSFTTVFAHPSQSIVAQSGFAHFFSGWDHLLIFAFAAAGIFIGASDLRLRVNLKTLALAALIPAGLFAGYSLRNFGLSLDAEVWLPVFLVGGVAMKFIKGGFFEKAVPLLLFFYQMQHGLIVFKEVPAVGSELYFLAETGMASIIYLALCLMMFALARKLLKPSVKSVFSDRPAN